MAKDDTGGDRLERLLAEQRKRRLTEPPAKVLKRAIALKDRLGSKHETATEWLVRLVFDSVAQPMPAGALNAWRVLNLPDSWSIPVTVKVGQMR